MESNINQSLTNYSSLTFCKHLRSLYLNPLINKNNSTCSTVNFNNTYTNPNFYHLKQSVQYKKLLIEQEAKNLIDEYLIRNINMEWIALHNPQNLSMNSLNREGCIFTMAFNDIGTTMAASNHNHHIEIWDMQKRKLIKTIRDHKEIVTGLEYFHGNESNMMLSCSLDKTIKVWRDYSNIDTFLDHSDWVRCISISKNNRNFLSGCVSSVIKLWDLNEKKVLTSISNPNVDPDMLNTVNSLQFMNNDDNIFLCGLRNGTVKIFDKRVDYNYGIIKQFKAHKNKLNSIKFNSNDLYLLSSGRDSVARLWDFRNLPNSDSTDINVQSCCNEYKGHVCKGFNIDCNFFAGEKYVISGSEDSHIYIYDTSTSQVVTKYKTNQKCINLVKPLPECWPYSFAFTGLEEISIHVWGVTKQLARNSEIAYNSRLNRLNLESNVQPENNDEYDEYVKDERKEKNFQIKLIEEIMSECGDLILRIFHANNLTYSNGMNFDNLMEIIQKNNDHESLRIIQVLNEKLMKKLMESMLDGSQNKTKKVKNKTKNNEKQNNILINCKVCNTESDYEYDPYLAYYDMMELDQSNFDFIPPLDLPNNYNSFNNLVSNEEGMNTDINNIKLWSSNESSSFKYNYLLK